VNPVLKDEVFGLLRPSVDVHTLGISAVGQLLRDCGFEVFIAPENVAEAINKP